MFADAMKAAFGQDYLVLLGALALIVFSAATAEGLLALFTAGSVALALAAGVILGEYVAQPLKREARRLESRLAGPRLVGPLRVKPRRRD